MSDDPLDLDTGLPARIAADAAALAPLTLSVARRLLASADTLGVIRPDHGALASALGADVAGIVSALDQLARPLQPAAAVLGVLERHEQRVVIEPVGVLGAELLKGGPQPRRHGRHLGHSRQIVRLAKHLLAFL